MAMHAANVTLQGRAIGSRSVSTTRSNRRATRVVVQASLDRDAQVKVAGFAAAATLLFSSSAALASPVDVFDDRKVIESGFLDIYEARDLDVSVKGTEGTDRFAFKKSLPIDQVAARAKAGVARLDGEVLPAINKSYWTEARQAMRRAMGTLRYDFNTLADAKGLAKATKPVTKETFKKVDALDFAIRSKDKEAALKAFEEAKAAVDAELSSLA